MAAYVRNLWYMAAWAEEVPDGGMLARTLLDKPWVIHRLADGTYAMLEDRCPHRFVPLSIGREARRCDPLPLSRAGLRAGRGLRAFSPFPGDPPAHVRAASMPVVEKYRGLWFWPGDPALADPATDPRLRFS